MTQCLNGRCSRPATTRRNCCSRAALRPPLRMQQAESWSMATISAGADGAIEDWVSRTAAPLSSVLPQSDIAMLTQMKRLMNSLEISSQMVPAHCPPPLPHRAALPTHCPHCASTEPYCASTATLPLTASGGSDWSAAAGRKLDVPATRPRDLQPQSTRPAPPVNASAASACQCRQCMPVPLVNASAISECQYRQ